MAARGGRRDRRRQSDPLPPAPRGLPAQPRQGAAHRPPTPPYQTDPPAAGQTAPGAWGHAAGRDAQQHAAGQEGGPGPGATGHPPQPPGVQAGEPEGAGNEPQHEPPRPSAPRFPRSGSREAGVRARWCPLSNPPKGQGSPPPPQESQGTRGGNAARPVRHTLLCRHPPAPTVTRTGRQTRASSQVRPADHSRGRHADTNKSKMAATPSMN